jgi:hypothetical protein
MNKVNPNLVIIAALAIGGFIAYNKFFGKSKEERLSEKALEEQEKKNNIWAGVASLQKTTLMPSLMLITLWWMPCLW